MPLLGHARVVIRGCPTSRNRGCQKQCGFCFFLWSQWLGIETECVVVGFGEKAINAAVLYKLGAADSVSMSRCMIVMVKEILFWSGSAGPSLYVMDVGSIFFFFFFPPLSIQDFLLLLLLLHLLLLSSPPLVLCGRSPSIEGAASLYVEAPG